MQVHSITNLQFKTLTETVDDSNGRLFGGLIRNVAVGLYQCRDIDIWFLDDKAKNLFLYNYGQKVKLAHPIPESKTKTVNSYPFTRYRAEWIINDSYNEGIPMDLIVSDKFPVNDFTINLLSYRCGTFRSESDQFTKEDIIGQIKQKKGYFLPYFAQVVQSTHHPLATDPSLSGRITKFQNRGYKFGFLPSEDQLSKKFSSLKVIPEYY